MPAVTVDQTAQLPSIGQPPATAVRRKVALVAPAQHTVEGAGFEVYRPFPGVVDAYTADPFYLLDQLGPVTYGPGEAVGAPWHPHRGFEMVTYVIDGIIEHHDSNGGGGIIGPGDTQWMTAGAGILHDEVPAEAFQRTGGAWHTFQLWVNLPASKKFVPPAYQTITGDRITLLTVAGGALVRLVAGELDGHAGPGTTHTPITYAHVSIDPGVRIELPWNPAFNALAYVIGGSGSAGVERRAFTSHQFVVFGEGDVVTLEAAAADEQPVAARSTGRLELLLLGGLPIKEPIVQYGPFLMNTRQQIVDAIDDFQNGRMGTIPS